MNLTRCPNGHFYDEEKYGSNCPHCAAPSAADDQTVAIDRNDSVTVAVTKNSVTPVATPAPQGAPAPAAAEAASPAPGSLADAVQRATIGAGAGASVEEDSKTISYYGRAIGTEPVVGWLVCIEGNHFGEDFRLKSGRNFIGRSTGMDVAIIGDATVARDKHAIVVYDPKSHKFLVQAGDSKELCYVNDAAVLQPVELKLGDILALGSTKLYFIPLCGPTFDWESHKPADKDAA
jgi:hypothetical protein